MHALFKSSDESVAWKTFIAFSWWFISVMRYFKKMHFIRWRHELSVSANVIYFNYVDDFKRVVLFCDYIKLKKKLYLRYRSHYFST